MGRGEEEGREKRREEKRLEYLAELHLVIHLLADVLDIVVDHGESDADAEDRDDAEGDGRVGHELVGLDARVHLHLGWTLFLSLTRALTHY